MLVRDNEFFQGCGLCDTTGCLADMDRETAVTFGTSAVAANQRLGKNPTPANISYEAEVACKISQLPAEDTQELFERCLGERAAGRCFEKVQTSLAVPVNDRYL